MPSIAFAREGSNPCRLPNYGSLPLPSFSWFLPGNLPKRRCFPGLDARRDKIISTLDEARLLREEAEAFLETARERHQAATKDAEDILTFAHEEAERLRLQAETDLKAQLARREKQALDRISQAETARHRRCPQPRRRSGACGIRTVAVAKAFG